MVASCHAELVAAEAEEQARINAFALKEWAAAAVPGWGLEEKSQGLDAVVSGAWQLAGQGGRYSRAVQKFESWVDEVSDLLSERKAKDLDADDLRFVEGLDAGWREDCRMMGRQIEIWKAQLRDLGHAHEGSSLEMVLVDCRALIDGMLTELSTMQQLERDAMQGEKDWIAMMNNEASDSDDDTTMQHGVWMDI